MGQRPQKVTDKLKAKLRERKTLDFRSGLSTGSTLLNMALTGRPNVGLLKGFYYLLVGDTNSGKTFFSRTLLAEATLNQRFDDYRLIYDDVEGGALMDTARFFGQALADRLESPKPEGQCSQTVEEFYFNLDNAIKNNRPFIYVLDSQDALSSKAERDKFDERKSAFEKGRETTGIMSDGKAKKHSSDLRQTGLSRLKDKGSILLMINQTRDNLGFGAQFQPKTRSGGRAIEFFAATQMWTSIKKKIKRHVKGKDRQVGILTQIKVKRSRFTGREVTVEIPIYWSSGLDDVGSCVDWLIEEGHWKLEKGIVKTAKEFKVGNLSRDELIKKIEDDNLEKELRLTVQEAWSEIESGCHVSRKNRYHTEEG